MRIWKRLFCAALCLCLCAELLPVTAQAAAALPVIEIGTSGNTYQYAKGGVNLSQLAYGTKKAETPISTVTTETGNGGTRFTLDTGWDRNFKLIYREIPVKVTVPANTEYIVTFSYIFNGSYHQHTGQTTAKFAAQAIYLDKNRASTDVTFYTAAGSGVKTTRGTSEVANVHSVTVTNGNKPVEKPGSSNGSVFTAKFRNDTAAQQAVTRYFGVWAACGDGSENPSSMTLRFTLTPVTVAYTVNLNPNDGTVRPASKQVTLGGQYGDLPTPTRAGFTFIGWYTKKTGGTKVGRYDTLVNNASHTLYARWSQNHTHEAVPGGGDKTFDGELNTETFQLNTYYWLSTYDNYYLTTTFTSSYQLKVPNDKAKYICLNGKTFTSNSSHRVSFSGNMNNYNGGGGFGNGSVYICDCGGGGGIINTYGRKGMVFRVDTGSLYLYGGTFRAATAAAVINGSLLVDGAALYATDTAIDDYGSYTTIIKSGIVSSSGAQAVYADKSSDYNGFFYVRGGTIENTGEGCAIRVGDEKTVHLSGSPIITGKSCDFLLEEGATVTVDGALTGVFSVGLSDSALVTPDKPWTIAVGSGTGNPDGHFVLPDGEAYKDLYLQNGTDADGKPIVQVCRHTHTGGTAKCTEWGKCTGCGKAYLEPLGHAITKHDGKDPTCTEPGWWAYETCSRCDYTTLQKIPANGHKYGALVPEKPATCTAEGMKAHYQCADCKTLFSTNMQQTTPDALKIPLAAHQYGDFKVDKPATCTENGSKSKYCAVCKKQAEVTEIPATGHNPVIDAAVAPTCTQTGLTEGKHCSVCNTVLTPQTTVEKLPHSWDDGVETKAPTCTEEGVKTFTCSRCHDTKPEPISALGHDWGEWEVKTPATETTVGSKTRTCKRDPSHTETETIPQLDHTHKMEHHPAVDADCGTGRDGNIEYWVCPGCKKVFSDKDGAHEITFDQTVRPFAHDLDTDWSHNGSSHWHVCKTCGQPFESAPHDYDDDSDETCDTCGYRRDIILPHIHNLQVVDAVSATCVSAGNKEHYRCTACGERFMDDEGNEPVTEDEVKRDPLGHDWQEATCETPKTCKRAGCSATEGGPLGHDWTTGWMSDAGFHWHECLRENCGEKSGHAAHIPGPEATEAAPQTCTECGYVIAPALEHTHVYDRQSTDARYLKAAAGCTTKAVYFCSCACGEAGTETFEAGTPLGHDWGRYIVTTPATETSEGVETRTCQRDSSHTQTRAIPKLPASTYGVSGEVHESGDDPAEGVNVTLVLGDREIASTTTDDKGKYSFGNVAPGVYNLVAKKDGIIMTVKVAVISKDVSVDTITMPKGKTNSVVEVKSEKPGETVEAVVGNLETVFKTTGDDKPFTREDQTVVNGGGSVEIKLTVTKTDTGDTSEEIKKQLSDKTNVGLRLELKVSKTVTEFSGSSETTPVMDTDVLLETIIRLPAELQGKDSYTVYRLHGTDVHMLTAEKNANGEFIEVSGDKTAITIHAKLYSEYVIAYQERGETGGNGGNPGGNGGNTGGNTGNDNGGGHGDRDDGYTPPSVPAPPETNIGYRACHRDDACPIWPFADAAPTAWYHDGVHYCIEKGLMHGISADKFLPDGSVTRAQLAAILWRLEGNPAPVSAADFSDAADGAWYAEAVRWAAGSGVVKGYADGRFRPNDAVTREQMATLLYRFAEYKGYDVSIGGDTDILRFTDGAAVGGYAVPAMRWACGSGLMTGAQRDGGMALAPRDTTTRVQTATLLTRFQSAFAKEP